MSDWTIINLLDVDDSAAGRLDGLEVRMSRKQMESRDVGVSLFRYGANVRNPMSHQHREQEEAYVVVSGSGRVRLDYEIKDVRQWDVVRVAPEVVRAFEAGPEGHGRRRGGRREARGRRRRDDRQPLAGRRGLTVRRASRRAAWLAPRPAAARTS